MRRREDYTGYGRLGNVEKPFTAETVDAAEIGPIGLHHRQDRKMPAGHCKTSESPMGLLSRVARDRLLPSDFVRMRLRRDSTTGGAKEDVVQLKLTKER